MKTKRRSLRGAVQFALVLGIITTTACSNQEEQQRAEMQRVREKSEQLATQVGLKHEAEKKAMQDEIDSTMNEIDNRLNLIREQKGMLAVENRSGDARMDKKEHILNNIALMDALLDENAKKIKNLQYKVSKLTKGSKEMEAQLAAMQQRNSELDTEINSLKDLLAKAQQRNDELTKEVADKNVAYSDLKTRFDKAEDDAYSVYYIAGTRSSLKKMKITDNSIFDREMNSEANPTAFKKVDMRSVTSIPVEAKKAKLVTDHAENSYKWEENADGTKSLSITNPNAFWKTSKFLVIETRS